MRGAVTRFGCFIVESSLELYVIRPIRNGRVHFFLFLIRGRDSLSSVTRIQHMHDFVE